MDIYNNLIQANLSNDDGGGIRFLMAGNFPMNVYNNMIVNNVSTHEGGGISLNDAPNVRFYNNTVMKNLTTATAVTSNGQPAPAGLSTGEQRPAAGDPAGRAHRFQQPAAVQQHLLGQPGRHPGGPRSPASVCRATPAPIDHWDVGTFDEPGDVSPTNSIIQRTTGGHPTSPVRRTAG